MNSLESKAINTIRILSADAVQKANSGHPGTPMGLAPIAHVLWSDIMHYNPKNPDWANRDRFILSCGHACMLQYSILHLTGYDVTMEDIKNFRQLHSKTAGHPEYGLCPGVEVTTGPLGQGFANGVGMAIAQQYLASRYNKPGFSLFDYHIYAICSDGDLMEGVASEAASVAGHLKLGKIVYLYDDNRITIEGNTDLAFSENVPERFKSYGWHVQTVEDGNDIAGIKAAIENAKKAVDQPSLICVRTQIGYGSPNKVNTAAAHGAPLGEDELILVKKNLGFDPEKKFYVPEDVEKFYMEKGGKGQQSEKEWNKLYQSYKQKYPSEAAEYETFSNGKLPEGWDKDLPVFQPDKKGVATRKASGVTLNAIADKLPLMIGGSADLAPSTDTFLNGYTSFSDSDHSGRNLHFGIREHGMGAILNGMALTKGIIPYGATFLIFYDYMRPPVRLAAIMKIRPIFVYTHDSIALGEDGTTHQPIEQLAGLRSVPNMTIIRPADANETVHAWRTALNHQGGPVAIILTRQNLPTIDQNLYTKASALEKGAYILSDCEGEPQIILMGTGSEVHLLIEAQEKLKQESIRARVVSFPSWELFEKQDKAYREKVLPGHLRKRLAVEAGSPLGWDKYITEEGGMIAISQFGESAPGPQIMKEYGFSVENVIEKAKALLKK